jgi:hypothetical protein
MGQPGWYRDKATGWTSEESGFDVWQGYDIFLFSRPTLRPTMGTEVSFPVGKAALYLVIKLRMCGAIFTLPHMSAWCSA